MDNKRIATGYDVELQLMPEKVKGIIDSILYDILPSIKKEIDFDAPINIMGGRFNSEDRHAVFEYLYQQSDDEEQAPILRIILSCEKDDDSSWLIKPKLESPFLELLEPEKVARILDAIPSITLPSNITTAEIIGVPSSDGYAPAIVLLADLDFAALLGVNTNISLPAKIHDTTKALSFLLPDARFAIGINKSVYESLSVGSRVLAEEIIDKAIKAKDNISNANDEINVSKKILEALRIKKSSISVKNDTLVITIKGKYDLPKTNELDLSFKIKISIKFKTGMGGAFQVQSTVKTEFDYNAWYTVLGTLLGSIVLGPVGGIVGLHTNSIIKRATRDTRNEINEKVKSIVQSPNDYCYCSDNGVGKLRPTKGLVNQLNCFFSKPIMLIQQSDAYFYTTNYVANLRVASTFFDDNGATIWGDFGVVKDFPVCGDVTLKRIKYYKNGMIPVLVYEDIHSHKQKELSFEMALATIKTTERIASESFDLKTDNCRNVAGMLPMSFLNFPKEVQRIKNEINAFKFDNGLIAKKEELIKLYKNGMILIKDVKLVGSEGNEYFKTVSDKDKYNNLSYLPSISKEEMESINYDE